MRTPFLLAAALLTAAPHREPPLSAQFLPPDHTAVIRELRYSLSDHAVPLQSAVIRTEQRANALLAEGDSADKTYLLLVASRQPLRVDRYLTHPDALDSAIGPAVQRSQSMDAVATAIVRVVANVSSAGDIAYDMDLTRRVIPRRR